MGPLAASKQFYAEVTTIASLDFFLLYSNIYERRVESNSYRGSCSPKITDPLCYLRATGSVFSASAWIRGKVQGKESFLDFTRAVSSYRSIVPIPTQCGLSSEQL